MPMKPIHEQRTITAKYRCVRVAKDRLSFEPVQRQHPLGDGRTTDLADIGIVLNDEIRKNMGEVKVDDVKEMTLTVTVLAGFEMQYDT